MNKIKSIGQSVLITLSFFLVIGIVSSVAMMTMKNAMEQISLISAIAQSVYLLLISIVLWLRKKDLKSYCNIRKVSYKECVIPAVAGFGFSVFSNVMQLVLPIPEALKGGMTNDMGNSIAAFVIAIFVVAPIVEEVTFRGIIMTKLRENFSPAVAILISAGLFGIMHLMAGGIVTVIHAFFGGLIFALAYEKTKSLLPAIVAHFFANVGGIVVELIVSMM